MSHFSHSEKARKSIQGYRQKVRIALRCAGVTGKFQVNVLRNGNIAIISKEKFELPIQKYDERDLVFILSTL